MSEEQQQELEDEQPRAVYSVTVSTDAKGNKTKTETGNRKFALKGGQGYETRTSEKTKRHSDGTTTKEVTTTTYRLPGYEGTGSSYKSPQNDHLPRNVTTD